MQLRYGVLAACLLGFLVSISLIEQAKAASSSKNIMSQLLPEAKSAKELKNNLKVMLTKMKLRSVPLAKKRSERELSTLYKERRRLEEEIAELETSLGRIRNYAGRQPLQVMESDASSKNSEILSGKRPSIPSLKVTALTKERTQQMDADLEDRRRQLEVVKHKISRDEKIIKDPESFISVPSDYGRDPEGQRELEKELLIKDRLNMEFRNKIKAEELQPTWLTDNF